MKYLWQYANEVDPDVLGKLIAEMSGVTEVSKRKPMSSERNKDANLPVQMRNVQKRLGKT